ncbi:MAG: hypothetical protein GXY13_11325 [Acidimicrobiales bacterium]|nr:hypothetical protein [Acidimicrobiales bacterium]
MCDTFCVRRPDGMLFAKNSDRPVDEAQIVEWLAPRPAARGGSVRATHLAVPDVGAAGSLGSRPTWMWGVEHGVNEHGVAIGNEKVWTVDDPRSVPPALLGMDLVRLGLERGSRADDALDAVTSLLADHGQGGSGEEDHDEPYWSSFLIVDGDGGWVLETSNRSWVARPVGEGAAISNRLTIGTDWSRSASDVPAGADWDGWRDPAAPTGLADHRLAATRACVGRGPVVTAADAVATLRDHGTGPWGAPGVGGPGGAPPPPPVDVGDDWSGVTVCMHVRDYQCTTASMVADLPAGAAGGSGAGGSAPIRVWASVGGPCTGVFLPVGLPVVPEVLGDAGAWAAFSALGRGVEVLDGSAGEALARIRAVLDPIEDAAWSEGDDLWSAGAGPDRWRTAATGWSAAVRAALRSLAPGGA